MKAGGVNGGVVAGGVNGGGDRDNVAITADHFNTFWPHNHSHNWRRCGVKLSSKR